MLSKKSLSANRSPLLYFSLALLINIFLQLPYAESMFNQFFHIETSEQVAQSESLASTVCGTQHQFNLPSTNSIITTAAIFGTALSLLKTKMNGSALLPFPTFNFANDLSTTNYVAPRILYPLEFVYLYSGLAPPYV